MNKNEKVSPTKNERKPAKNYDVLSPAAFLHDIELESSRARKRVWTQAMYMNPGVVADRVCTMLKSSVNKKLDARLHIDWFGQATTAGTLDPDQIPLIGPMLPLSQSKQEKEHMYEDLKSSGVSVTITNKPTPLERIIPYRGRNHIKITIIDDIAYLGGINYGDEDSTYKDFMVKLTDKDIVNTIAGIFLKVEDNTLEDTTIDVNPETTIIIDSGTGRSPILSTTVKRIRSATECVYYTSQFVPDGDFLQALYDVYTNGCIVEGVLPHENTFSPVFEVIHKLNQAAMVLKSQNIPIIFIDRMVHSKLVLINGQLVIFGSHNMSEKGVQMKTAEIALFSSNATLVRNLQSYYDSLKYDNST